MEPTTSKDTDTARTAIEGWTPEEKYYLLMSLKAHGSKNIGRIENDIKNKNREQISAAIEYYKEKAISTKFKKNTKRIIIRRTTMKSTVPLVHWADHLTQALDYKQLDTETVTAVRLLSQFDKLPESSYTEGINFRKIYNYIADAMEGKSIPDDRITAEIINNCALDTAITSKSFIKPSVFTFLINSMNVNKKDAVNFIPRPTADHELVSMRQLCSQRNYNPFNIGEDFLKCSSTGTLDSSPSKG